MINNTESKSFHKVQSGVTEYPIGFQFFYNTDGTPQLEVVIGVTYLTFNHNCKLSDDNGTLILIPTEEEAEKLTGPDDFSWMDKWVDAPMVILRAIPFVQESDYQLGRISSEQIEKDFDLSVMRDQILADQIKEHTDDVQGEIDALHSRIDFVQEEHLLDMAAVDETMATKAAKADVDAEFATVNADLATRATKAELANAKTVLGEGIQGNADAILKTRNDYEAADQKIRADMNSKDSELETITNDHAARLKTLRTDVDDLGDQVSGIESKIPESASETNPLVTKGDLADIDLDDYVKKSGDTMTGDLVLDGHDSPHLGPEIKFVGLGPNPSYGHEYVTTIGTTRGTGFHIKDYVDGDIRNVLSFYDGFWGYSYINDKMLNSGSSLYPWKTTFTKALNAGNKVVGDTTSEFSGDLIVPSEGGTLARMEDLIDLRADINEADSELQTQITAQAAEIATKAEKDSVYTKEQVDAKVSSVYKVKGSVANYDSLPTGANVGDVYNLLDTGVNYVWTTDGWDALGGAVDLTDYAKKDDLSGYLPLSGGTLTGAIEFEWSGNYSATPNTILKTKYNRLDTGEVVEKDILTVNPTGDVMLTGPLKVFADTPQLTLGDPSNEKNIRLYHSPLNELGILFKGTPLLGDNIESTSVFEFDIMGRFYAKQGYYKSLGTKSRPWSIAYVGKLNNGADIAIPTTGGTMALKEDIDAVVGDISTALTAILGE